MYIVGEEEIEAISKVIRSTKLFRYTEDSHCARFEKRWGEYLGRPHVRMCASGTTALVTALSSLGIGPGDEVIVPAHTYMATALAVLSAGAIPVIADVDESITLDPASVERLIGPHTRAVIPVHMWGLVCDMDPIMDIAARHDLLVIEDACQCVGGGYKGRMAGSIGHSGAFSFNYFKVMTCGEGGAVVSSDEETQSKVNCLIDACGFFWTGKEGEVKPFAANSARASEIQGAMLNVQLDRLPGMLERLRAEKKRILRETADTGLQAAVSHSLDHECGAYAIYNLPTPEAAKRFSELSGGNICGNTGRHTAHEWSPVLGNLGHLHPSMDPYRREENRDCRKDYSVEQFQNSLDILNRSVMIRNHPEHTGEEIDQTIEKIRMAAKELGLS